MLQQAIGLSIILGFISTELLGLFTGGLVSAGYLAFFLEQPYRVASTLVLSLVVYGLTKLIGKAVILYGRRRFMLTVILGILLGWVYESHAYYLNGISQDLRIIGYMIPGLLANDMCKQGAWRTVLMDVQRAAAERMQRGEEILKDVVVREGIAIEDIDLNQTGLIGPEWTPLTTTPGIEEAKRTALDPNFAALLVRYFEEAGLEKG